MEIQVTFPNQSAAKETLQVTKKLGTGKFTVYQAYSAAQKTHYALKAFQKDTFGTTQYQKETLLANLSHPNIIQNIPVTLEESEKTKNFHAVLTEFAKYGDFFELVVGGAFDSEVLIRTYFHQLIAGLEYMHAQGIAHLDLKLENLMMGSGFNLKVIDFDQAQRVADKKITSGGTKGYRAPEVIDGTCRDFAAADLFSAGIILFAFRAQEYPFAETKIEKTTTLKYYNTFMKNNKAFWDMKSAQKKDSTLFSESFKELVNGLLDSDVIARFTIEDVKKSKWYNGPVLDSQSLQTEMKTRWDNFAKSQNKSSK